MSRLKHLIIEAHRRSLWQVLGIYLFSAWVVLQVVGELTRTAGLPEWVPPFALVLLLIGLPVVLATAVVQEGVPGERVASREKGPDAWEAADAGGPVEAAGPAGSTPRGPAEDAEATRPSPIPEPSPERSFLQRHLTWKRSLLGGVAAFSFLTLLVTAYLVSWATGIGPVGSLIAQGEIEEGERIILADFGSPTDDPTLGALVTDALRIDLLETPILRVLEASDARAVLRRMQVESDALLTPELAREAALREGIKAVLEGEVARAGPAYVLTATLRHAESGRSLAAFRETARSDDELIPAMDRLSRRIRERVGESLRSIHAGSPLEKVTTPSFEALRLYSQADRAFHETDYERAIALLEEALEVDPEFAMAWRRLAVILSNIRMNPARQAEAARRAYELPERLSERERHLTAAYYHDNVTGDLDATAEAYRRVLSMDPDDPVALNNLSRVHRLRGDREGQLELLYRAVHGPGANPVAFGNLIEALTAMGRLDEALDVTEAFGARYPDNPILVLGSFWPLLLRGEEEVARTRMEALAQARHVPPPIRARAHDHMARGAAWRGRIEEARERLIAAERSGRDVDPSFHWLRRLWTAHFEVSLGDPERGARVLRAAVDDGVRDAASPTARWHFFHAFVLGMAGLPDEVEAVLGQWEADVPQDLQGRDRTSLEAARALVFLNRGDPRRTIETLEGVRSTWRCEACFAKWMGWALQEEGRLEEAAAEWDAALAWRDLSYAFEFHFTQNLWILQRIGPLYEELGETEKALSHYRRMVDQWADADPELQPRVREWRERIAALEAAR